MWLAVRILFHTSPLLGIRMVYSPRSIRNNLSCIKSQIRPVNLRLFWVPWPFPLPILFPQIQKLILMAITHQFWIKIWLAVRILESSYVGHPFRTGKFFLTLLLFFMKTAIALIHLLAPGIEELSSPCLSPDWALYVGPPCDLINEIHFSD